MRKAFAAAAFILALSFSAIAGVTLVNLVAANPMIYGYFPTEPIMTPPTINVQSPTQKQNYNSNDVWLNFTITKPETWFTGPVATDENGDPLYAIRGSITSVYYVLDGSNRQNISVQDISFASPFLNRVLNFSTNLLLPEGVHSVKVGFEAESLYRTSGISVSSVPVNGASEVIRFTVAKPSEPEPKLEPLPTALAIGASGASIAGVAVCVFYYQRKRNH